MVLRFAIPLFSLLIGAAAFAASEFRVKPGMWELVQAVTSFTERGTQRLSRIPTDPHKSTSCERDGRGFLKPRHPYCHFLQSSIANGRVHAVEQCTKPQTTITYRYNGHVSPQSWSILERMTVADHQGAV